jgi:hypothetical protein
MYEKYETLRDATNGYLTILEATNNDYFLNRALTAGEISSLDYFLEVNYYYSSYDKFLELEKEYNKVVAKLMKHRL